MCIPEVESFVDKSCVSLMWIALSFYQYTIDLDSSVDTFRSENLPNLNHNVMGYSF